LQQQDYSALQPLVIVLKSILKQNGLGDVSSGGLGSWSLANMAIAHLMVSSLAFQLHDCHRTVYSICMHVLYGGNTEVMLVRRMQYLAYAQRRNYYMLSMPSLPSWCWPHYLLLQAEDAAGGPVDHPGAMLFSFLRRFGMDWNLGRDAVAVAQGGIVLRDILATMAGPFAGQDKLAVKDPLSGVYQALAPGL
jgi:hypothetical protein